MARTKPLAWWIVWASLTSLTTSCDEAGEVPEPSDETDACSVRYPHGDDPLAVVPLRGGFARMLSLESAMATAPGLVFAGVPDETSSSLPGDYNGDGRTDVIFNASRSICAAGVIGSSSWLFLQDATGHLQGPTRLGDLNDCRLAADLDGDRDLDLVCWQQRQSWVVRWNDGDVTQGPVTRLMREDAMMAVSAWDLDDDGVLDLLFSGWNSPCHALRGRGDRTFDDVSAAWGLDSRGYTWSTGFVDFDDDGVREVYVVEDGFALQ